LPRFEPFDVRPARSLFETLLRLEWVGGAVLLWGVALFWLAMAVRVGPQEPVAVMLVLVLAALALAVTVAAARRFVYWRVDRSGIHKHCWGLWNWDLPWTEIVSRTLGPAAGKRILLINFVLPILRGPYQAMLLKDQAGRRRKVNRLALNGDRLDALVRYYLDPAAETEFAERYAQTMRRAEATHERQETVHAPLHLLTEETPAVRLAARPNEPLKLPVVCCNCLGPATAWVVSGTTPGLRLFFNPERIWVPLCADCHARTRTGFLRPVARGLASVAGLFWLLTTLVVLAHDGLAASAAAFVGTGILLGPVTVVGAVLGRRGSRHPPVTRLVEVVRSDATEGWMDVRFGNPAYARLAADLNQSGFQPRKALP
jgi:hypothetical protein